MGLGLAAAPPPYSTPLPAVGQHASSDGGDSSEGTRVCQAAGRALWPGPGPPMQTALPPAGEGAESGCPCKPHTQGAYSLLLPQVSSLSRDITA